MWLLRRDNQIVGLPQLVSGRSSLRCIEMQISVYIFNLIAFTEGGNSVANMPAKDDDSHAMDQKSTANGSLCTELYSVQHSVEPQK